MEGGLRESCWKDFNNKWKKKRENERKEKKKARSGIPSNDSEESDEMKLLLRSVSEKKKK